MPRISPSSAWVRPRAMRALVRSSPKESRSPAPNESRRPSLRSSYSEISRSRSSVCIRNASITAEATSSRSAERRPFESLCSSASSSVSRSLLWRYSLSLRIMPSPPCSQFHREHTPLVALAVGLEEPQEGLPRSQLRGRGGKEIRTKPPLGLHPTLGIRREDWSQTAQVLDGNVLRQVVATVYVVGLSIQHFCCYTPCPSKPESYCNRTIVGALGARSPSALLSKLRGCL